MSEQPPPMPRSFANRVEPVQQESIAVAHRPFRGSSRGSGVRRRAKPRRAAVAAGASRGRSPPVGRSRRRGTYGLVVSGGACAPTHGAFRREPPTLRPCHRQYPTRRDSAQNIENRYDLRHFPHGENSTTTIRSSALLIACRSSCAHPAAADWPAGCHVYTAHPRARKARQKRRRKMGGRKEPTATEVVRDRKPRHVRGDRRSGDRAGSCCSTPANGCPEPATACSEQALAAEGRPESADGAARPRIGRAAPARLPSSRPCRLATCAST